MSSRSVRRRYWGMQTTAQIARECEDAELTRSELDATTRTIIGAAQRVHATLGRGFLEKVYENALAIEITNNGLAVVQQAPYEVSYGGVPVGRFAVDLLVDQRVIVELKSALAIEATHRAQCVNYLKASSLKVCLLLNFGANRLEVRRFVNNY